MFSPAPTYPSSWAPMPEPSPAAPRAQAQEAVLPRFTRVRISGNNRTKSEMVGRQGYVRSAMTLGGWHEVVLEPGPAGGAGIVRVQRNALEVIAMPSGEEVVRLEPGWAVDMGVVGGGVVKRKRREREKEKEREKERERERDAGDDAAAPCANIGRLRSASLKKYRRVYNLNVAKDCSRDELIGAVRSHFERTKVDETAVIMDFLKHIRPQLN